MVKDSSSVEIKYNWHLSGEALPIYLPIETRTFCVADDLIPIGGQLLRAQWPWLLPQPFWLAQYFRN